jgi:hypothetical protein
MSSSHCLVAAWLIRELWRRIPGHRWPLSMISTIRRPAPVLNDQRCRDPASSAYGNSNRQVQPHRSSGVSGPRLSKQLCFQRATDVQPLDHWRRPRFELDRPFTTKINWSACLGAAIRCGGLPIELADHPRRRWLRSAKVTSRRTPSGVLRRNLSSHPVYPEWRRNK